jgi:hypothetical protein
LGEKHLQGSVDLLVYGSAVNGLFEGGSSDIDISLFVEPPSYCEDICSFLKDIDHERIINILDQLLKCKPNMKITTKNKIEMSAGHLLEFYV